MEMKGLHSIWKKTYSVVTMFPPSKAQKQFFSIWKMSLLIMETKNPTVRQKLNMGKWTELTFSQKHW